MTPVARAAAARLRIDSATAEVLRAFDAAEVLSILLKGASNREWLEDTPAEGRWYADCDLLIRPDDRAPAARVLTDLGFVADFEARKMPSWWREPALSWKRNDGAIIDLHQTVPGVRVDDERAWTLLSAETTEIVVGGYPALALAIPGRAMHLAIHAAQHGPAWSMGLADLTRALERADDETWRAAAQLAYQLDATALFAAGLRLVSRGQALVERLGLAAVPGADAELFRGNPSALTVEQFLRTGDQRIRLSMIRSKLFPPATFLRYWSPLADRGRAGLLLAYAWRPIWVLARVPAAVRGWRRARRLAATD